MRSLRPQLALAYCLGQLVACADTHEPDDDVSYRPKIGGPIVEFPRPRGGSTYDEVSGAQSGGDAAVAPPAVMVSPAGGGGTDPGSMSGGVATGGGGTFGGVAGGVGGPGGGTTGALGGFAGGTGGVPAASPPACDAGAAPAPTDAAAADAGADGEAEPACAADAAVDGAADAAAVAPDPAP